MSPAETNDTYAPRSRTYKPSHNMVLRSETRRLCSRRTVLRRRGFVADDNGVDFLSFSADGTWGVKARDSWRHDPPIVVNNNIVVSTDCLGLCFGYNRPKGKKGVKDIFDYELTVLGAAIELDCIVREIKYYDAKKVNGSYNITAPIKVVFEKNGWLLTITQEDELYGTEPEDSDDWWESRVFPIYSAISKTHNYGTRSKLFHTSQLRTQDEQFMYDIGEDKFIEIKEKINAEIKDQRTSSRV